MITFQSLFNTDVPTDSIAAAHQQNIAALKALSTDELINRLVSNMVEFAISLTIAIAVFYVGKFIIRKLYNITAAILLRRKVDKSLSTFILSLIRILLFFILIVTVIGILGINTSSFLALFASAGVAIGMALSGTLQNFAGGVLILLLKPYKVGDYIEAQGFAGTVTEIQIFSTIICTPDNKSIIIPNGGLSTGSINNWSREDYRRVEWTVSLSYGNDVETARNAILDIISTDDRIVKHTIEEDRIYRTAENPNADSDDAEQITDQPKDKKRGWIYRLFHRSRIKAHIETWEEKQEQRLRALLPPVDRSPSVMLAALADSSIDLTVRAWTRASDYWAVFYSINEKIYNTLPKYGLSFPFPQMDIHMVSSSSDQTAGGKS